MLKHPLALALALTAFTTLTAASASAQTVNYWMDDCSDAEKGRVSHYVQITIDLEGPESYVLHKGGCGDPLPEGALVVAEGWIDYYDDGRTGIALQPLLDVELDLEQVLANPENTFAGCGGAALVEPGTMTEFKAELSPEDQELLELGRSIRAGRVAASLGEIAEPDTGNVLTLSFTTVDGDNTYTTTKDEEVVPQKATQKKPTPVNDNFLGSEDLQWCLDFTAAFFEGAVADTPKVLGHVCEGALETVCQPVYMIQDVTAAVVYATGDDGCPVPEMQSWIGQRQQERVDEGQSGCEAAGKGVVEVVGTILCPKAAIIIGAGCATNNALNAETPDEMQEGLGKLGGRMLAGAAIAKLVQRSCKGPGGSQIDPAKASLMARAQRCMQAENMAGAEAAPTTMPPGYTPPPVNWFVQDGMLFGTTDTIGNGLAVSP